MLPNNKAGESSVEISPRKITFEVTNFLTVSY